MTTPPETNQAPAETPQHDGPVSQVEDDGRFGENRAADPYEPGRRASNAFRIGMIVFVLLIFAGAWWLGSDNRAAHKRAQAGETTGLGAPRRVFFPTDRTDAVGALVDPQAAAARSLMAGWWSSHGTKADDTAFVTWLAGALPGPTGDRNAELAQVRAAAAGQDHGRSPYLPAARFLSNQGLGTAPTGANGQIPIWGLEAGSQAGLYDATTNAEIGGWATSAVTLATEISSKAGTRLQLSSPYLTDPSLAPDVKVKRKGACPCSYPAGHAAVAAAARTVLGTLQPPSDPEYAWMQRQIDYASMFLGHAYPSDLVGGTLLGDAVGEYVLVTQAHRQPAAAH